MLKLPFRESETPYSAGIAMIDATTINETLNRFPNARMNDVCLFGSLIPVFGFRRGIENGIIAISAIRVYEIEPSNTKVLCPPSGDRGMPTPALRHYADCFALPRESCESGEGCPV